MLSLSGESGKICESVVETDLHNDMVKHLGWETLSPETLNAGESTSKRDFVRSHIGVLLNVVRRANVSRDKFSSSSPVVEILYKFRDVTEYPVLIFTCSLVQA